MGRGHFVAGYARHSLRLRRCLRNSVITLQLLSNVLRQRSSERVKLSTQNCDWKISEWLRVGGCSPGFHMSKGLSNNDPAAKYPASEASEEASLGMIVLRIRLERLIAGSEG
jgi:hypothetical protein